MPAVLSTHWYRPNCTPLAVSNTFTTTANTTREIVVMQEVPSNTDQQRMEISPSFCDVAVARWQNFTGHKAVRDDTGD